MTVRITHSPFGLLPDGTTAQLTTLTNSRGASVSVVRRGAALVSVRVPDRAGRLDDVVLGFDSIAPYLAPDCYFGMLVGRFANRIANAGFELAGVRHCLDANHGPHHLHGGSCGLSTLWWREDLASEADGVVQLSCTSPAGAGGYPGTLEVQVRYRWTEDCVLEIDIGAQTDAPTVVNLVAHPYFNLDGTGTILDHQLRIDAQAFLPVDALLIPTGEQRSVVGTPFDFREARRIGDRIDAHDELLLHADGYDHCFILRPDRDVSAVAAELESTTSGRQLRIHTTQPGLQFYSGNHLRSGAPGHGGRIHAWRTGLCLEAQHFPDSPNRPAFPDTVLRPGNSYRQQTRYTFGLL